MTSPFSQDKAKIKRSYCAVFFRDINKVTRIAPMLNNEGEPTQADTFTICFETYEKGMWRASRAAARKIKLFFPDKGLSFGKVQPVPEPLQSEGFNPFRLYFTIRRLKYSETGVRLDPVDCRRLLYSYSRCKEAVIKELLDDKVYMTYRNQDSIIQNPTWRKPNDTLDQSDSSDEDPDPFNYQQKMALWENKDGTIRPTKIVNIDVRANETENDTESLETDPGVDSILKAFKKDLLTDL